MRFYNLSPMSLVSIDFIRKSFPDTVRRPEREIRQPFVSIHRISVLGIRPNSPATRIRVGSHTRTCYAPVPSLSLPKVLCYRSVKVIGFFLTSCVCLSICLSPSHCIYIPFCKYPRNYARIPSKNVRNVNRCLRVHVKRNEPNIRIL